MAKRTQMDRTAQMAWLVAGLTLAITGCSKGPQQNRSKRADWKSYNYELREPRGRGDVNVSLMLRLGTSHAVCRILVNCRSSEDYYFVELREGTASIGVAQYGIEHAIGTRGEAPLTVGTDHRIVVKRRKRSLVAVLDGQIVAWAYDDALSGGKIGVGVLGDAVLPSGIRVQPVGDLAFADDFMRTEDELGQWHSQQGTWQIEGRESPSLSANAFSFVGKGTDAICTTGNWFWDSYRAQASCCPKSKARFGLVLCYRSWDDCFLVTLRGKADGAQLQLIRRSEGTGTVLAETACAVGVGQWVRLGTELTDGAVEVSVDGVKTLSVRHPGLSHGLFGLYTADATEGTWFDDVGVMRLHSFREDFEEPCIGRWDHVGGDWQRVRGNADSCVGAWAMRGHVKGGTQTVARTVTGDASWRNYTVSAAVGPAWPGNAGLLFCYLDSNNHYLFRWGTSGEERTAALIKVVDGVEDVLAQQEPAQSPAAQGDRTAWFRPSVRIQDGHIVAQIDGLPVLEAFDRTLDAGRIGLMTRTREAVVFDDIRVVPNSPSAPLLPPEESFSHERSMSVWAGAESDWEVCGRRAANGGMHGFRWHRVHCYGDVTMALLLPNLRGDRQEANLVIGARRPGTETGHRLRVERTGTGWSATMTENGRIQKQRFVAQDASPGRLALRRAGTFVTATVDGTEVGRYRAENGDGCRVGYSLLGAEPGWDDVRITTDNVYNELFRSAPSDWLVGAGLWEVTNRWECDDRWSFFCGRSEGLAAVWHKHRFAGDLVVEFFAGVKMDSTRGDAYQYASDINLTVCGDGEDLNSGYSFVFGGWNDNRTAIVRRKKIVAQTAEHVIPREKGIHRHWFHIRVEKQGGEFTYSIDGKLVLTYTDPEPLPDGQLALWTYNNGIMLARVRVSHHGATPVARVRLPERPAHCVYDVLPAGESAAR